jgi:class 3 adenylate cyclase/predicted ATPase
MDVAEWLRGLGFEQYVPAFRDNDIDGEVLRGLTADDLRELGVASIGHRRRLLDAIARLVDGRSSPEALPAPSAAVVSSEAERRQLTVMFCDLVGSTGLSARLDPEDLREVIAAYHRAVAGIVRGFDGFVAKYMGDGVLVYFGYPQAHEDDAERAIRAGLDLVDAVGRMDVKSVKVRARVGIATGLVIVGDLIGEGSAQEQSVVGETPNLAARLQSLAEPNAVVIAANTRRLVGDLFEYRDLGIIEVRGIDVPVPAWQVLRPSGVESRFEALHGSVLMPLVGRDEEIDLLLRRWARAKAGDGQVVLISGEPGIGKSRIAAALVERLQEEPHIRLRYFCSPYRQDSALFPFIDQLGRAAGFSRDDMPPAKLQKLESLLTRAAPPAEDIALLADLLSLPASEHPPLPNLSPQRKKQRTLGALMHQLEGLARQRPVVMVFEDAHWIDPTSRELLDLIIEHLRTLPVLVLVTFRPEFQPPWTGQPQVTMLTLNRLDRRDRTTLVAQISGGKALPDEVVDLIADRTDGVPLFVEELTKAILESGVLHEEADRYVLDRALPPLAVPTTLHDSLMARLDRLDSVKRVAQIGAAIGREFPYPLLRIVSGLSEHELQTALNRLVASELVFQRGTPPDAVYSFKHALIQDAAHGSLLRGARQQLHARIVEALEAHSPETVDSQPELLAQHCAEGGLVEKSVAYWGKAGNNSAARSAMAEAVAQFQKGLDQLALLPDTAERQRHELEFCSSLAAALFAVKGVAAPETGQAYARAHELCEQLGFPSEFLDVLRGQSRYHAYRGELDLALRLVEEVLDLSRQRNDSGRVISGLSLSGQHLMCSGKFASSRLHLEEALALAEAVGLHEPNFRLGTDAVNQGAYLGTVLFILGYPDQALARSNAAIAGAGRLARRQFFATSLAVGTRLLSLAGDNAALAERADQLVGLATEQGFPHWRAQGTIYRGWAKVKDGGVAEGTALLRAGSAAYRAAGSELFVPHYIDLQAGACEIAGQVEEALSLLDDALQIVERTGERWLEAELNRHKGQLLLRQGHTEAAEELYHKALSVAREQEAKLWELRAAASLARLRRDQGRYGEARDLLAPIYGWFTEGFDTPDLKDAKTLLDELV